MFRRLAGRRPSLSTVIALLALVIASAGTAYATAPSVFSIADHATPANTAKVNSSGQLSVAGSATPAPPKSPFNFTAVSYTNGTETPQMAPTAATLALTGIRLANGTANGTNVTLQQYATDSTCSIGNAVNTRSFGVFAVPAGQTVEEQLATPIVLKPLSGATKWCLVTSATGSTANGFFINYNGYTVSGTFAN